MSIELSDRTKVLILVAIIGIFIFFFLQNGNGVTQNEGSLIQNNENPVVSNTDIETQPRQNIDVSSNDNEENEDDDNGETEDSEINKKTAGMNESIVRKFKTRNTSKDGQFVYSNFTDGKRGGRSSDLNKFFEDGHPLDKKVGFQRNDENNDVAFANYIPGKRRKLKDVDKFNAEALLPKELAGEYFDDPYESTSVKNTHLINTSRPIGVNTIQTTLKNPSHDIRGSPPNPKYAISPWMNSSYEPDTNLRNQSLCY
jgi:hypothetical protein